MTTTLDVVDRALEIVQVKAPGQATNAEDADLGLRALISLLDAWQLDPHSVIGLTELVYTPAAGVETVTIGPGADIDVAMPVRIDRASTVGDAPLEFATEFGGVGAYWMRGYDVGTLHIPASDGSELRLWVELEPVTGFASLTLATVLTLPAGYLQALEYGLADKLTLDYGTDPVTSARIKLEAAVGLRKVKRANARVPQLDVRV